MEKVVIWGTGKIAIQFIYQNKDNIDILFFLDNFSDGKQKIFDYNIYKPNEADLSILKKHKIIVCSTAYYEISKQLNSMGMTEFENYISSDLYKKKIALLIGNCHMPILGRMLRSNQAFAEEYGIFNGLTISEIAQNNYCDNYAGIVKNADLIIQQDIRTDNAFDECFSVSFVEKIRKKACIHIVMINSYGLGRIYYPLYKHGNSFDEKLKIKALEMELFPFDDLFLDELIKKHTLNEILDIYSDINPINNLKERNEEIFAKYYAREKFCDVKCTEYVYKNYKDKLLFYDLAHPINDILWMKVFQINHILGIDSKFEKKYIGDLGSQGVPIYPFVKNQLELTFDCSYCGSENRFSLNEEMMNVSEYMKQYYYCCAHNILKNE